MEYKEFNEKFYGLIKYFLIESRLFGKENWCKILRITNERFDELCNGKVIPNASDVLEIWSTVFQYKHQSEELGLKYKEFTKILDEKIPQNRGVFSKDTWGELILQKDIERLSEAITDLPFEVRRAFILAALRITYHAYEAKETSPKDVIKYLNSLETLPNIKIK